MQNKDRKAVQDSTALQPYGPRAERFQINKFQLIDGEHKK